MTIKKYVQKLIEAENSDQISYDIGRRGGNYTMPARLAILMIETMKDAETIDFLSMKLPAQFGAGCNYLGGGLRGVISVTGNTKVFIEHGFSKKYAKELEKLAVACQQRYMTLEDAMNDEQYEDGDINWEAVGTRKAREAGLVRAY